MQYLQQLFLCMPLAKPNIIMCMEGSVDHSYEMNEDPDQRATSIRSVKTFTLIAPRE